MRSATPTAMAAMLMRPLSSTFMAVLKPMPSVPPIRLAAGTQSSKITSQVWVPGGPSFVGLAERDARGAALDDEGGCRRRPCWSGRCAPSREDAGLGGVGDVALGAVEHVVVAVTNRGGAQAGGVEPLSGSVRAKEPMSSPVASAGR
jgi:hypothetical protein